MKAIPIRIRMLYEKIDVFIPFAKIQMVGEVDLDTQVEAINLLTENETSHENNIYVCKYIPNLIIPPCHLNSKIIIVTDQEKIKEIEGLTNYLVIYSKAEFNSVYNALTNAVALAKDTNYTLYEKYIEKGSIQELIILGEHLLTNPFMLLNKYFMLEGYSKNRKSNEHIYNDTIQLGELEYRYLALIMAGDIFRTLYRKGEVLLPENNPLSKKAVYIKELKEEDQIVGYGFLICENNIPMQEMLSYYSAFINNFTGFLVESANNSSSFQELRGLFLTRFLDVGMSREELELRAKEVDIKVKDKFFLAQVAFEDNENILEDFILKTISTYCPKYISFKYNDNLLILLYLNTQEEVDKISKELRVLIKDFKIRTGISQLNEDLGKLRSAYQQSTRALAHGLNFHKVNKKKLFFSYPSGVLGSVFNYSDFIQIDMLDLYYKHFGKLPEEFHRLTEIIELDQEKVITDKDYRNNDSNLLFRYLKNQLRINETARESYMHRNSLVYRLDRIEEKLGVSLEDEKTRERVMLTFLINDYKKIMDL